jgi:hypothetical protein
MPIYKPSTVIGLIKMWSCWQSNGEDFATVNSFMQKMATLLPFYLTAGGARKYNVNLSGQRFIDKEGRIKTG